jgi:uncharacterized protein YyaL (SSP411 family)
MAHESFENVEIAELLNRWFIPVKVDREERPDVDRVYMAYVQATTGYGGWPLSVWLTPELKPFFGGTYFPPEDRGGRHGFGPILRALAQAWQADRKRLIVESGRVVDALGAHFGSKSTAGGSVPVLSEITPRLIGYFEENFDAVWGGFGGAPKFPRASNIDFLLLAGGGKNQEAAKARHMVEATLIGMAKGGIHDHVGGGFHRYSVDEEWFVPHFEKMLYDQAQIAVNYLEAFEISGDERLAALVKNTLDYVRRDLTSPEGGFYSAEDADSLVSHEGAEHAEGAFYLWTDEELTRIAGDEASLLKTFFEVRPAGNIASERDPHGEFAGKNLLHQNKTLGAVAAEFGISIWEANDRLAVALERLRKERLKRPRPHRDEKTLTAWNGLAVTAFAKAGRVLQNKDYVLAAQRAANFVHRELLDEQRGILYRSYCDGRSAVEGFAEDYACWIQALIDLYEADHDVAWLQRALRLQDTMDRLFWDEDAGGYFNSALGARDVIFRLKEDYDGAEPAPSSVAASNRLRLAAVSASEQLFRQKARRTIDAFKEPIKKHAHALPRMACALWRMEEDPGQIVLAGTVDDADYAALKSVVGRHAGRRAIFAAKDAEGWRWLQSRMPWISALGRQTKAAAYLCEHFTCDLPITSPAKLQERLGAL